MAVKGSTGGGLLGKGGGLLGPSGSGTGDATRGPGGGLLGKGFGTLGGGFGLLGKGGGLLGGGFGTLGLTERTRRFMRRALSDAVDYVQTFDQAAKDIGTAQGIKVSSTGTSDADLADIREQVAGLEVTGVSLKPQGTRLEKLKGVQQTAEAVDWDATVEPPPPPVDQQQATFLRLDPETGRPVVLAGGKELFTTFTIGSTGVAPGQTVLVTTINGQNVMETPEQAKRRTQKRPVLQDPGKKDRSPAPLLQPLWMQPGGVITDFYYWIENERGQTLEDAPPYRSAPTVIHVLSGDGQQQDSIEVPFRLPKYRTSELPAVSALTFDPTPDACATIIDNRQPFLTVTHDRWFGFYNYVRLTSGSICVSPNPGATRYRHTMENQRHVEGDNYVRVMMLPLGGGRAIFCGRVRDAGVIYRRTFNSYKESYTFNGIDYLPVFTLSGSMTVEQSWDEQFDFAFLVGKGVAESITVTEELAAALDAGLQTVEAGTVAESYSETETLYNAIAGTFTTETRSVDYGTRPTWNFGSYPNSGEFDGRSKVFSYSLTVDGRIRGVNPESGSGIVRGGHATPLQHLALEDGGVRASIGGPAKPSHATMQGIVENLLPTSGILSLADDIDLAWTKLPPLSYEYPFASFTPPLDASDGYSAQLLVNPLVLEGNYDDIQEPEITDGPTWVGSRVRIPFRADITDSVSNPPLWSRALIYDWGKPEFCRLKAIDLGYQSLFSEN